MKKIIAVLAISLFLFTPVAGFSNQIIDNEANLVNTSTLAFNKYDYPENHNFDVYNLCELTDCSSLTSEPITQTFKKIETVESPHPVLSDGPMDSPWPMYCRDTYHTGRSPYTTVDTWDKIWKIETNGWAYSSAIDNDGTIYIGSYELNAVYPNGTLKWQHYLGDSIRSCPVIDENGVIYVGTKSNFCAIYLNGTIKWKRSSSGVVIPSPIIGEDGIIYYAAGGGYPPNGHISALYPNGTLKWRYYTNHVMYSSPAIGLDGTIYCGSHDNYVYALYPNNGTLRWKYNTGSWVHGSPTIADDGTVYIGSDNGYLYAFYPNNGTVKWKCNIGCIRASPTLDEDGTLYVGVWEKKFYAIYPNGTIKWSFNPGAKIWGSSAALSKDYTLYFGTCDLEWTGGIEIIALYTDGTVKWRKGLDTVFSSPAIGSDGTVYIGSCGEPGRGFLNAFGVGELEADANGPYYGLINKPVQFTGYSRGGYSPHNYHWDFGDAHTSEEQNPTHIYKNAGNYTVTLTVTDDTGNTSSDTTYAWIQTSNTPPNKPTIIGPTSGKAGTSYDYIFTGTDTDGSVIWYFIDWGDNTNSGWLGPYDSGEQITESHAWNSQGTYTIKAKAKDPYSEEGPWGTLTVTMPLNQQNGVKLNSKIIFYFSFYNK